MNLRMLLPLVIALFCPCMAAEAQLTSVEGILPTQQLLGRYGLERAWWGKAVLDPGRDHVVHLTMDEETVFVQASSGVITAFDAENGRQLWAVKVGLYDEPSFPAVSNETQVLVVVGTRLIAIDKRLGQITWDVRLPGQPSTGPATDNARVYIGTLDGSLYAFNLRRIQKLYNQRRLPQWSAETLDWRYKAVKEVTSPPIPVGGKVAFASRDGSVYSVSAERRELQYQFETDGPILASLAKVGSRLYVASEDFNFYCLNADNGKLNWVFANSLPIRKSPYIIENDLYLAPDRGGLYSMSSATGERWVQGKQPEAGVWWKSNLTDFVAATRTKVFATDLDGNLAIVSRENGASLGMLPFRQFTLRIPNDRTDRIYLCTTTGVVIGLREINRTFPIYYKFPERAPIFPQFEKPEGDAAKEP